MASHVITRIERRKEKSQTRQAGILQLGSGIAVYIQGKVTNGPLTDPYLLHFLLRSISIARNNVVLQRVMFLVLHPQRMPFIVH